MPPSEHRSRGLDRRHQPTPFLSIWSFLGGRRHKSRRGEEAVNQYVDLYSMRTWMALSLFLALNLLDSSFTLNFLQRGGEEGNPLALALLEQGVGVFLLVKSLGIGLAASLFCVLKNFRNGRIGVLLGLVLYQLLLLYHLSLYFNFWPGSVQP